MSARKDAPVVFLFPGQGSQHPRMAAQLYAAEPFFRALLDHCCALLAPRLGLDLRSLLFPPEGTSLDDAAVRLAQTALAQPALFVVQYCLARLWMHWGVRPAALLGHSIGQYTAACLAGVFSLEDALALVALRGKLLQQLPTGTMLAVPLPEAEIIPELGSLLDDSGNLAVDLAAVNTPSLCVVAGPTPPSSPSPSACAPRGVQSTPLHTSHAFHSHMVEPALPAFSDALARIALKPPTIPVLCNLSGQRLSDADATSVAYWARHLRQAVRFSDSLHALSSLADQPILLEVGPGSSLSSLARLHPATAGLLALQSLPHPKHQSAASTHLDLARPALAPRRHHRLARLPRRPAPPHLAPHPPVPAPTLLDRPAQPTGIFRHAHCPPRLRRHTAEPDAIPIPAPLPPPPARPTRARSCPPLRATAR